MLKTVIKEEGRTGVFELKDFKNYDTSVSQILDDAGAASLFTDLDCILLKPNLVTASSFPVTTAPDFCAPVIEYVQACSDARIILAEGCGDHVCETPELFNLLGYDDLARTYGIELMDLNTEPLIRKSLPRNPVFPEIFLPEIAFNSFIVSLPVLKAHSLAVITGTLKNMMGFAPPEHYSGGGIWKKAAFHAQMQDSIIDLCRYRTPDLTLMDASVGLADYHLGGPECNPPVNKLLISNDPFRADQCAAGLLNIPAETIRHIHRT